MINELIIHLGDTKTGSTSIQSALASNICKASGVSFTYPTRFNHNGLAATLFRKRRFEDRAAAFKKIYVAFQKSDADYGIISAEHFQMVDPNELHQAIETYWPDLADRVRLVAYVRPHADKFLSSFSEHVKLGAMKTTVEEAFLAATNTGRFDYTPRFEAWREVFGDRFELRPFVRAQLFRSDVVADFFKFVLQAETFELGTIVSANTSLTVSQLSLLREVHIRVNKGLRPRNGPRVKDAQSALGRIVAEHLQSNGLGKNSKTLRIPTVLADQFIERYAVDAAALDEIFFEGSPMSDAMEKIHLKATTDDQSLNAADHFTADVISSVHVFADLMAEFVAESPERLKKDIQNIRAKAMTSE
ncbi:MAG: hypothetical protein HRU33_17840 [Rhodobacteraceae bacterium]|nr:hypothetical protein [Paracoccaceae bacterium]